MHKGVCFNVHHNIVAIARHVDMHNVTPWRTRLALHRTKRGEVILAQQTLCGAVHPLRIQRLVIMRHALAQHRRTQPVIIDDVAVATRRRAKAGVKIVGNSFHPTHRDVTR